MNYTVKYTIDVDAENQLDAALLVEQYMREGIFRPALEVTNNDTGCVELVDLEKQKNN